MFNEKKVIKLGKNRNKIACIGDAHFGHPNHVERVFNEAKEDIFKNKYGVVLMGDMIECREPKHKFFVPGAPTIDAQMKWYTDLIDELNDEGLLLGVLIGNHEFGLIQQTSSNEIKRWCEDRDVAYLDYSGALKFEYNNHIYSTIFWHGAGAGTTVGGQANRLMNYCKIWEDIDAVVMAHTHQLSPMPVCLRLKMDVKTGKFIDTYTCPALTGSFFCNYLEGPAEYGERNGYPPLPMGYNLMTLDRKMAQSQAVILRYVQV